MDFEIVVEWEVDGGGFSAFLPDLPGCVAAGRSLDEVLSDLVSAIDVHLEGMREDGHDIPEKFRFDSGPAGGGRAA